MFDGKAIAKAYEQLVHNPNDADVILAYKAFRGEIDEQFDSLPVSVEFVDFDPYKSSTEMFWDINVNNRLRVFSGGEPHELMGQGANLKFRAVHDYYGHFLGRNRFSYQGECEAYIQHSKMFSELANKALFTETVGQNSWFNFSDENYGKPNALRKFAEQKAGIMI